MLVLRKSSFFLHFSTWENNFPVAKSGFWGHNSHYKLGVCFYSKVVLDFCFRHWRCPNRDWGKGHFIKWKKAFSLLSVRALLVPAFILGWDYSQFCQSIISKCSFSLHSLVPAFFLLCHLFRFLLLSFSISCVSVRTYGNVTARKVSHYRSKQKLFTSFVFTLLLISSFYCNFLFILNVQKFF